MQKRQDAKDGRRPAPWRAAAGIGIAAVLAVALVLVLVRPPPAWLLRSAPLPLIERLGLLPLFDRFALRRALRDAPLWHDAAPADRARPDVVLIVLDTLRRDRLGLYGYAEETMPRLSRWARGARVYERARSTSSWTVPAHASLFTGLLPSQHGARGAPYDPEAGGGPDVRGLSKEVPTLAEALRDAGYATVGLAANRGYLGGGLGLSRGFDVWISRSMVSEGYPTADRVTALARGILRAPRNRPLFLFLNYMDPHTPLVVRDAFLPEGAEVDQDLLPPSPAFSREAERMLTQREPLDPEIRRALSLAYDGELRFLDAHLGSLLEALGELGIGEGDLVVVTSDHGELLGEHELLGHSKGLFEELVRIPLLVRGPGFVPGRDRTPVQLDNVPAWILDAAGLEPLPGMRAHAPLQVSELYGARHKDLTTPALRERFDWVLHAFVRDGRKLTVDDRGRRDYYDLTRDPNEQQPLADPPWADPLDAAAEAWLQSVEAKEGSLVEMDESDLEMLRALGYVE